MGDDSTPPHLQLCLLRRQQRCDVLPLLRAAAAAGQLSLQPLPAHGQLQRMAAKDTCSHPQQGNQSQMYACNLGITQTPFLLRATPTATPQPHLACASMACRAFASASTLAAWRIERCSSARIA